MDPPPKNNFLRVGHADLVGLLQSPLQIQWPAILFQFYVLPPAIFIIFVQRKQEVTRTSKNNNTLEIVIGFNFRIS